MTTEQLFADKLYLSTLNEIEPQTMLDVIHYDLTACSKKIVDTITVEDFKQRTFNFSIVNHGGIWQNADGKTYYAILHKDESMTFEKALIELKDGKSIRRLKWDKDVFISKHEQKYFIDKIYTSILMFDEDMQTKVFSWNPNVEDILANDWQII